MKGTVRSVGGTVWLANVTIEEAKQKMLAQFDTYYPSNNGNENYFVAPFVVLEDRYLYNNFSNQSKCASFETVLVFKDAHGDTYRRFIFRPDEW
jgi:hypothetical protein